MDESAFMKKVTGQLEVVGYRWTFPIPFEVGGGTGFSYASHWSTGPKDAQLLCLHSEALAGFAVRDARIATQEAQIKMLQSDANSWQSGYDEGRRMGAKHCMGTIDQLRAELAALGAELEQTLIDWGTLRLELAEIKGQAPRLWFKYLIGAQCKPDGRCYDISFVPSDGYQPLYAAPTTVAKAPIGSLVDELRLDAEALGLSVQVVQVAKPPPVSGLVPDIARFEKHAVKARECLSECDVVLLSSIRRLLAASPSAKEGE